MAHRLASDGSLAKALYYSPYQYLDGVPKLASAVLTALHRMPCEHPPGCAPTAGCSPQDLRFDFNKLNGFTLGQPACAACARARFMAHMM